MFLRRVTKGPTKGFESGILWTKSCRVAIGTCRKIEHSCVRAVRKSISLCRVVGQAIASRLELKTVRIGN